MALWTGPRDGAQDDCATARHRGIDVIAAGPVSEARRLHRGDGIRSSATISSARRNNATRLNRIWERLRAKHAFTGGYTIVKDYVRAKTMGGQEMFVPLAHPLRATPRPISAKHWWSSLASSARRTTWSWISRTATTGS